MKIVQYSLHGYEITKPSKLVVYVLVGMICLPDSTVSSLKNSLAQLLMERLNPIVL